MIWLWILGILLALVALVCLLRVGVTVYLDERVTLDVRAGPVKFHIDPDQPKKPKKNKKPDKEKKPKETKPEKAKKPFPRPTVADIRDAVSTLAPPLGRALSRTRRSIRIHPMTLSITVGGAEEPADAAALYGYLNASVWSFMPWIEKLLVIPEPSIHIGLNFAEEKTAVRGQVGVSIRVGQAIAIGLGIAIPALQWFLRFRKAHKNDAHTKDTTNTTDKGKDANNDG